MKTALKWALGVLVALVLGVAGLAGTVAWRFNAGLPAASGQAQLPGADGPITIVRDRHGVPHIFAQTEADLYRGLGFAHAQDRMFQMDATRRAMQGRLAELVGEAGFEIDARARIMNWAAAAEAQLARLSPANRALVEAYAEGVNAQIALGPAPPEYALFFASPEAWRAVDSFAVSLAMADSLTGGETFERARARLARVLSPEQLDGFLTGYPDFAPTSYAGGDLAAGTARPATLENDRPGSNAWVVAGARTASGRPILANDPHLPLGAPGPFYLSRLQGPDGALIGASLPGAPNIVIGRSARLAWGTTTHQVDAADEYPLAEGAMVTERLETIRVRHLLFFHRTETITVRSTEDGPILDPRFFDIEDAYGDQQIVLRTIADDPDNGVAEAIFTAAKASSVDGFFDALAPWTAPPQNLVVADIEGGIGLISPGRFPARDAAGAWRGEIGERIMAANPEAGFFATANNLQTPRDFAHPMPGGHDPFRVTRIAEVLAADQAHTADATQALQLDRVSVLARRTQAAIAAAAPETADGRAMQARLAGWNGLADPDIAEPTFFAYWVRAFGEALYKDELGAELFEDAQGPRDVFIDGVLNGTVASAWCDDVTTSPTRETCAQTVGRALDQAAAKLREERGLDEAGWRWGEAHAARFAHPILAGLPLIGERFVVETPFGGNSTTVNVARHWHSRPGYATGHAAGMRMIVDFADLEAARFIVTPGQSGNPLSPHFADLAALWGRGEYIQIRSDWGPDQAPEGAQIWQITP